MAINYLKPLLAQLANTWVHQAPELSDVRLVLRPMLDLLKVASTRRCHLMWPIWGDSVLRIRLCWLPLLLPVPLVTRPLLILSVSIRLYRHLLPRLFLARIITCWQLLEHMIIIDVLALISFNLVFKLNIVIPVDLLDLIYLRLWSTQIHRFLDAIMFKVLNFILL